MKRKCTESDEVKKTNQTGTNLLFDLYCLGQTIGQSKVTQLFVLFAGFILVLASSEPLVDRGSFSWNAVAFLTFDIVALTRRDFTLVLTGLI
jgi:hypothetical protein